MTLETCTLASAVRRRKALVLFFILLLSACQAPSQGPRASGDAIGQPAGDSSLSASTSPTAPSSRGQEAAQEGLRPQTSAQPDDIPTPSVPVPLGEAARVGGFTVIVHGTTWVDDVVEAAFSTTTTVKRLFVDLSLRNDTDRAMSPSTGDFAVLGPDGEPLNREWRPLGQISEGLLLAELRTDTCVHEASLTAATVLPVGAVLPGEAVRTWTSFADTPGLDQPQLQLDVQLPTSERDQRLKRGVFLLHGEPRTTSLPWAEHYTAPSDTVTYDALTFEQAMIGPIESTPDALQPTRVCTWGRTVRMRVTNTSAESVQIDPGRIQLLDADGRRYTPLTWEGSAWFEPRAEGDLAVTYGAILGVRDQPVALVFYVNPATTTTTDTDPPYTHYVRLDLQDTP